MIIREKNDVLYSINHKTERKSSAPFHKTQTIELKQAEKIADNKTR